MSNKKYALKSMMEGYCEVTIVKPKLRRKERTNSIDKGDLEEFGYPYGA